MPAEIYHLLVQHGALLITALTVISCTAAVQWRKVRQSASKVEFKSDLLARGTPVDEIERLLPPETATRKGLLEQFGALPDGLGVWLIVFCPIVLVFFLILLSTQLYYCAAKSPERNRSVLIVPELTSERPTFALEESGTRVCRLLYLNDGYAGTDFNVVAVVRDQSISQCALAVQVTPGPRPMTDGRVYAYDVNIQALRGTGVFTLDVIASDRYGVRGKVSFDVHVGDPLPDTATSNPSEPNEAGSADLACEKIAEDDTEEAKQVFQDSDGKQEDAEIVPAVDESPQAATTGAPAADPIESWEQPGEEIEEENAGEPIELTSS